MGIHLFSLRIDTSGIWFVFAKARHEFSITRKGKSILYWKVKYNKLMSSS